MEKGEYELFLLKKALETMKVIGKYIVSEEDREEIQIKEIQSRMENMELKGDRLREKWKKSNHGSK